MQKRLLLVLVVLLVVLGINSRIKEKDQTPLKNMSFETKITEPERHVYVGAWVGGSWDNSTKTLNTKKVSDFEKLIDKKLAIVNIYTDWTNLTNPLLLNDLQKLSDEKWTPMISSNPLFFDKCPKENKSLYETIASGRCDTFLKEASLTLAKYEKPIMLRFAWEMNLPNMYWSTQKLESTPADFVNAWRHFYKISKENAPNVLWVLSFNTTNSVTTPYKELFPGDEFVDWVAIDGYNWGNSHPWGGWASFDGTFRASYNELIALTKKPVMLSEVNSAPTGGNKTSWLTDMLEKQIPDNYKQVGALIFFNENKNEGESVDWRLEKSGDYVTAVKQGLTNKLYVSSFP